MQKLYVTITCYKTSSLAFLIYGVLLEVDVHLHTFLH